MPLAASPILTCASARRVLRLDDLLLAPEGLDLRREALLVLDQLLLLRLEPGDLLVEALELLLDERLALERLAREVLPARAERLPCLAFELGDVLLELLRLHLEPLLRGDTSAMPFLTFWSSSICFS